MGKHQISLRISPTGRTDLGSLSIPSPVMKTFLALRWGLLLWRGLCPPSFAPSASWSTWRRAFKRGHSRGVPREDSADATWISSDGGAWGAPGAVLRPYNHAESDSRLHFTDSKAEDQTVDGACPVSPAARRDSQVSNPSFSSSAKRSTAREVSSFVTEKLI